MSYFFQGLGVFLGVLAGTFVTILVHLYFQRRAETQQTRNLKFELDLNMRKIDAWLEELARCRNAVNGDSLHAYFGYFDLSKSVSITASEMLQSGLLYKKLSHEQIGQLQVVFSDLSFKGEQFMNAWLDQIKQEFARCKTENQIDQWSNCYKPEAVRYVDYWEGKFRSHQRTLRDIVNTLG
jgi:hypothetical protein